MHPIKLKRFNNAQFLKGIGRELLHRLFSRFEPELKAANLDLPPPALSDNDYFSHLGVLCLHLEQFPPDLNEALIAIEELSSTEGVTALQSSSQWIKLQPLLRPESSAPDIATQVWLLDRKLLHGVCNRQRLRRLTSFEHAASPLPPGQRAKYNPEDKTSILSLTVDLDSWFARHSRGYETTQIDIYPMDDEFWYIIRHGDLFSRVSKVERRNREILNFRPEKDDVVIVNSRGQELRVNARTQTERDLYIRMFGRHLFASEKHFSERNIFNLEPLRTEGLDILRTTGLDNVQCIALREFEARPPAAAIATYTSQHEQCLLQSWHKDNSLLVHRESLITRAIFDIHFARHDKPHPVEIKLPNFLKISRCCDASTIHQWITRSNLRQAGELVIGDR